MSTPDEDGMLVAEVTIRKYVREDGMAITTTAHDGAGDGLPIVDTLGLLSFATADQYAMFEREEYDDDE